MGAPPSRPRLVACLLAACLAAAAAAAQQQHEAAPGGSTAFIAAGNGSFISALADQAVTTIVLLGDYDLAQDPAARPEGVAPPALARNVTITGLPGQEPLLDLRYTSGLAELCDRCWLTFRGLALANDRRGHGDEFDSFTGTQDARHAAIMMHDVVRLRAACVAGRAIAEFANETARARGLPGGAGGGQRYTVADITWRGREFPGSFVSVDTSANFPLEHHEGRGFDGHFGGYSIWSTNVSRLCERLVTDSCLDIKSPEVCVAELIDEADRAPQGAPAPNPAVIAVAVAVPLAVLGLAACVLVALVRRRRKQQRALAADTEKQLPGPGTPGRGGRSSFTSATSHLTDPKGNPPSGGLCHADSATEATLQHHVQQHNRRVSIDVRIANSESRQPLHGSREGWEMAAASTSPWVGPMGENITVEFGELLGSGSYGRVYRASWGGRPAAVKVIEHDINTLAAVEAEAALLLSFNHPNLVRAWHYVTYVQTRSQAANCSGGGGGGGGSCHNSLSMHGSGGSRNASQPGLLGPWSSSSGGAPAVPTPRAACEGAGAASCAAGTTSVSSRSSGGCANAGSSRTSGGAGGLERTTTTSSSWGVGLPPPSKAETWLVTELADRGTLGGVICAWDPAREGDEQMLVRLLLLRDAARGLAALHKESVVHGDLNARNILVGSDEESELGMVAKLSDLGLARVIKQHTHRTTHSMGTLNHLAPELLRAGYLSPAADVYAMGITMWEVYTQQQAFDKLHYGQFFETVVLQQLRPVVPPGMPADYALVMKACWAPESADRPTVRQLIDCLDAMAEARQQGMAGGDVGGGAAAPLATLHSILGQDGEHQEHGAPQAHAPGAAARCHSASQQSPPASEQIQGLVPPGNDCVISDRLPEPLPVPVAVDGDWGAAPQPGGAAVRGNLGSVPLHWSRHDSVYSSLEDEQRADMHGHPAAHTHGNWVV